MPRRPLDVLFAAYAAASALALAFPHRPAFWPALLALHAAAIVFALRLGPAARLARAAESRNWSATLLDWYPLLLIPALYSEIALLNHAVHGGRYFDTLVLGWEQTLFGGRPSQELAARLPWRPLSETLHAAYLSYYFIIYAPPLVLWRAGSREAFRRMVFAVMLAFFAHYLVFIFFPVQGPRYLFDAPTAGDIEGGAVYALAHALLEAGSSRGAAFPSSHVAIAVAQTVLAASLLPRMFPVLLALTIGLALGAVYGGFHYATDAVAGALAGLLLVTLAPALRRRLERATGDRAPTADVPASP